MEPQDGGAGQLSAPDEADAWMEFEVGGGTMMLLQVPKTECSAWGWGVVFHPCLLAGRSAEGLGVHGEMSGGGGLGGGR